MLLSSLLSRVLEDVVFESLENPEELLEDEVQRAACMSCITVGATPSKVKG